MRSWRRGSSPRAVDPVCAPETYPTEVVPVGATCGATAAVDRICGDDAYSTARASETPVCQPRVALGEPCDDEACVAPLVCGRDKRCVMPVIDSGGGSCNDPAVVCDFLGGLLCLEGASVLVKVVVAEEESDLARGIVVSAPLVAPELVIAEVANVMWHKARRGSLTHEHATRAVAGMAGMFQRLYSDASLVSAALDIALALGHPVYAALYLALARNLGVPLVTADRRLVAPPPAPEPAPPAR